MKFGARYAIASVLIWVGVACPAVSAEDDLQSWSLAKFDHRWTDDWGTQIQVELRMNDNISQMDEFITKPSLQYYATDNLKIGLGYKFIKRAPDDYSEHDIWQEVTFAHGLGALGLFHEMRLEQRFRGDVSGTIPRIRYVLNVSHPLDDKFYLAGSEEGRFNLRDAGVGPVGGFEQNRLYGGLGYKIDDRSKLELGYLWRYERKRTGPNHSDHVLRLQWLFEADMRK